MTIEEELLIIINDKYKSLRAFAIEAGIPYTSLRSILYDNKGLLSASFKTTMLICEKLNVDSNELFENKRIVVKKCNNL